VLRGLPNPFTATRYHSLVVRRAGLPAALEVTAHTAGGVVMGLRHRDLPMEGVQFHPESVLSEGGHRLLANWLSGCGDTDAAALVPTLAAGVERQRTPVG
jgi:para-aminobenzoate synthetase component II